MHLRHLLPLCLLAATAVTSPAQTYVGTSDFSGSTNWAAATNVGGGTLTFTGSTLQYTATGASSNDRGFTTWQLGNAPSNASWSVMVDVHLTATPSSGSQSVNLNLMAANTTELPGDGNGSNMDQVTISIDRYFSGAATTLGFESMFNAYNASANYHPSSTYAVNGATDAALGIAFDSSARTLTTYYDIGGSANGLSWTALQSYNVGSGVGNFGMNWGTDTFTFLLMGASSNNFTVTGGQAYFDNFAATAVPEPSTYASLAGGLALVFAGLRRRFLRKG